MQSEFDIVIVGAATTGVYFGWQMAKKGFSVLIIDKEELKQVGQRLEIIHFVKETFEEQGVPAPTEEPELIGSWKGIYVSRLPLFFQRMYKVLEKDGVQLEFSCNFKEIIIDSGNIVGIKVETKEGMHEIKSKLVVDASGVACAVRSTLPDDFGVDTWKYDSTNRMFVILHYIKWLKTDEPHPVPGDVWPYYFVFFDPGYMGDWCIMGVIGPESFKKTEIIMEEFLDGVGFPPFELKKKEYCSFPLTRPPHSLVGNGFFCAGDAAGIMNPIAARGIPETWDLCNIAIEIIGDLLKKNIELSREQLWDINVQYFKTDGAELASQLIISAFLYRFKEKELDFLFKKVRPIVDPPGSDVEPADMKLSAGKIIRVVFKVLGGLFVGKISFRRIPQLIIVSRHAGKIKKHYKKYPTNPNDLAEWIKKGELIWKKRKINPRVFKTTTGTFP